MRVATLDLGSNTFLLLIAEVNNGTINVLEDRVTITRLGQAVDKTGEFHPEALERVEKCFATYSEIIKKYNVEKVIACATSAARDAKNKDDFFKLGEKYNIPIQIIDGDTEARVTFTGSTFDIEEPSVAVIDIGGGSTEVIGYKGEQISGKSIDVGSVRLTEKFISGHPVSSSELESMLTYIKGEFQKVDDLLPKQGIEQLIAVAGTPTLLACLEQQIDFAEEKVHKFKMTKDQIYNWMKRLADMTVEKRIELKGMVPKRADVIVAGLSILYIALDHLGINEIVISTKGVRYGLLFENSH